MRGGQRVAAPLSLVRYQLVLVYGAPRMRSSLRFPAFLCAMLLASACSVELQHDLSEDDANDIYVVLQKHSIDAQKLKEGEGKDARYVISVPKGHVASAAEVLREYSLPRPKASGLGIFAQTKGMIPTQVEERAMFMEAVGGEVSNALNRIPGVLEARTLVMIPEVNDLTQPDKKPLPSASVLVKYMTVDGKVPVSIEEVQAFVANSVSELKRENVKVLMTEAKFVSKAADERQFVLVFGIKAHQESATPLKYIFGAFPVLFTVIGVLLFFSLRKPSGGRTPPRAKTQDG